MGFVYNLIYFYEGKCLSYFGVSSIFSNKRQAYAEYDNPQYNKEQAYEKPEYFWDSIKKIWWHFYNADRVTKITIIKDLVIKTVSLIIALILSILFILPILLGYLVILGALGAFNIKKHIEDEKEIIKKASIVRKGNDMSQAVFLEEAKGGPRPNIRKSIDEMMKTAELSKDTNSE